MPSFAKMLKRKSTFGGMGFLLLVALIILGGRRYHLRLETQLLIILVLLFLGTFLLLMKLLKANRGAAFLEQSIKSQADDQKMSVRPEKRGEIEELRRQLLTSIDSLKKSKLAGGRRGRAALYALPWYMFIGPPAAGKTTAIVNSGLEFPFGSDIKGIGGTRNCDWFFSNSAIILDTAGRYVAEDEDREEWQAFLGVLKKHRPRRPINGVVVGMSITDILAGDRENLEWHAKNIRRRIDELIQKLGIRFPVYLVFTKCDLLQGFVEFFESYNRREREQIWGTTFGRSQKTTDSPLDIFDREFDLLVRSLDDVRLKQLSGAPKPENRGKIYTFPLQFQSIKESTGKFIGDLFLPNPYQESPYFRGFYFTSGTQEGVPIDRVIQAIARQFDLPADAVGEPEIQKKSYFIKDLFSEIIIPDQNSVFRTYRAKGQRSWARLGTIAASLALLALFVFGVSRAFLSSRKSLESINASSQRLETNISWNNPQAIASGLKDLDGYLKELAELERQNGRPWIVGFGMSRGDAVLDSARRLFLKKFRPFVERYGFQELAGRLRRSRQGADYPQAQLKSFLKAYLLMGSSIDRLLPGSLGDTVPAAKGPLTDAGFLAQQLNSVLDEQSSRILPQDRTEELRPKIERLIGYYIRCLSYDKTDAFENDKTLVANVRRLVCRNPTAQTLYERIRDEAALQAAPAETLTQVINSQDEEWVKSDTEIPEFFTKSGWETKVKALIEKEVENPEKGDWVCGETTSPLPDELQDRERLAGELRQIYFREYAETWWQFLRGIRYARLDNLDSAARFLKRMGSPTNSPLLLILRWAAEQTDLAGAPSGKIVDKAKSRVPGLDQRPDETLSLDRDFAKLRALLPPEDKDPDKGSGISPLQELYSALGQGMESWSADPGPMAKEYALKVLKGTGELPDALKTVRRLLEEFDPEVRRTLFEEPLKNVWAVIVAQSQDQLNTVWKAKVYKLYQNTLARYFPFDPESAEDASFLDMKALFDPQEGALWKFVDQELGGFVETDTWSCPEWMGQGISLSSQTREALTRATTFKQELFRQAGFRVRFQMAPDDNPLRVVSGPPVNVDEIAITVDGRRESYKWGGVSWWSFDWPGQEGAPGEARLSASNRGYAIGEIKKDGEWAWVKLLSEASIEPVAARLFRLKWVVGKKELTQVELRLKLRIEKESDFFTQPRGYFSIRFAENLN